MGEITQTQPEQDISGPKPTPARVLAGTVALIRAARFGIAVVAAGILFFVPARTLLNGTLVAALVGLTLAVWGISRARLQRQYGSVRLVWDEASLEMFRGQESLGRYRWEDLRAAIPEKGFDVQLQFADGTSWVIPREWVQSPDPESEELRAQLGWYAMGLNRALLPVWYRPVGKPLTPRLKAAILAGGWAVVGAALIGYFGWGAISGPVLGLVGAVVAILLVVTGWEIWDAIFRRSAWGRATLTEQGVVARGRLLRWSEIKRVDWSGPGHREVILQGAKGWPIRARFEATPGDQELMDALRQHPTVASLWQAQIRNERQIVLPWRRWYFASMRGVWLVSALFLGAGLATNWPPVPFLPVMFLLAVSLCLFVFWFSPVVAQFSERGVLLFPTRKLIPYDAITRVDVCPVKGALEIEIKGEVFEIPGHYEGVGRVLAWLRLRVSPDAFSRDQLED